MLGSIKRRRLSGSQTLLPPPGVVRAPGASSSGPPQRGGGQAPSGGGPLSPGQLAALGLAPSPSLVPVLVPAPVAAPLPAVPLPSLPPRLGTRKDAPRLRPTAGAARVVPAPVLDEAKSVLLDQLEDDMLAQSSKSSAASTLRTWVRFHAAWFPCTPAFPTFPASIRAVAAQMKAAGYRSWSNYLSRAKREHVRLGSEWDQQLDSTARDCTRSLTRGIGPPRQSAPLDLYKVSTVQMGLGALCSDGPVNPRAVIVLGAYFLTREIELSLALARNITLLPDKVIWLLPASKTDPAACSVSREWGCICRKGVTAPCPLCEARKHFSELELVFGPKGTWAENFPAFPTASGGVPTKTRVVETIEGVASLCGEELVDDLGRRRFGGHSLRVAGARHLAGMGLELYRLALLARWTSPVIMRYVAEAPMAGITGEVRKLISNLPESNGLSGVWDALSDLRGGLSTVAVNLERFRTEERETREKIDQLHSQLGSASSKVKPCAIQNLTSGTWHRTLVDGNEFDPAEWRSWCGWRFGNARISRSAELPLGVKWDSVCDRCFRRSEVC